MNNLLEMARLQSGGLALRQDWQSLPELVGSALRELDVPLRDNPLQRELPSDLPLLFCDGTMLERVLVNLLENASKYAGAKTPIGISASVSGEQLEVRVWDQGPGLPAGKELLIFEKFSRGDKESVIPGVGLGLAICRAIIEAHGGRIWAENRPQGGACFSFTLPLKSPPPLLEETI